MKVLRKAFNQPLDPAITTFVSSVEADANLATADILGSIAHVKMMMQTGLVSQQQGEKLLHGLTVLKLQAESGELALDAEYEDVHMNVEHKLDELIGIDAKSLHTARSRNDQVALDLRIYTVQHIELISDLIKQLCAELIAKGEQYIDVVMPGYTHLQRAQPISFGHAMHAFVEMLSRDLARFQDAKKRTAISPLGAGAIAGSSLSIAPGISASELGFDGYFANSIDAVSDRDFAAEFVFVSSLTAVHLSQIAETFITWCSKEFDFVHFEDAVTTTSSLMPQKKNPDPIELVRAKTGTISGELINLMMTLKGLPIGYNRDLQETKPPVIKSANTIEQCLNALTLVVKAMSVNSAKTTEAASDPELMATDLVEYLVKKGVPFRAAHETVAAIVFDAREASTPLNQFPLENFKKFSDKFQTDVYEVFDPICSVNSKTTSGGTAISNVKLQLKKAKAQLKTTSD